MGIMVRHPSPSYTPQIVLHVCAYHTYHIHLCVNPKCSIGNIYFKLHTQNLGEIPSSCCLALYFTLQLVSEGCTVLCIMQH